MNASERKQVAERLLQHELMVEARDHMRETLTEALWKRHSMNDEDKKRLDAMVAYHGAWWAWFERVLAEGKLAEYGERVREEEKTALDKLKKYVRF